MTLEKVVEKAIQHCIGCHILEDFLRRVREVNLLEYDFNEHMEQVQRDAEARGEERGIEQRIISLIRRKS